MRNKLFLAFCSLSLLAAGPGASVPASVAPKVLPTAAATAQQRPRLVQGRQHQGPQVLIGSDSIVIDWGDAANGMVPYTWDVVVENPNDAEIGVKVKLTFVTDQGEVVAEDWITGQVGPHSTVVLRQSGSMRTEQLDRVYEARGEPSAWWLGEAYKIRTLAAFVDGLQRLEIFFVLEDWRGRPVTTTGTVDLYIIEKERARAEFAGGGMRRRLVTLYARRFNIHSNDFARRRIGFVTTDYTPPAVTLGPIHYSIFDHEPRGDEGLVRIVFRTASGIRLVAEDRVFF